MCICMCMTSTVLLATLSSPPAQLALAVSAIVPAFGRASSPKSRWHPVPPAPQRPGPSRAVPSGAGSPNSPLTLAPYSRPSYSTAQPGGQAGLSGLALKSVERLLAPIASGILQPGGQGGVGKRGAGDGFDG